MVAAVVGALALFISVLNGDLISLGTLVGAIFLAIAAVRYRLAQDA